MDMGKTTDGLHALLQSMQKLYSGIMSSLVRDRLTAYHEGGSNSFDDDIGASLNQYINNLSAQTQANAAQQPAQSDPPLPPKAVFNTTPSSAPGDTPNPLSGYFKKNKSYSELAPRISDKLKESAWEHTHTAIRLARLGDFTTAKLHAGLANNAIKELAHYLPETEYAEFKNIIKTELLAKA